VKNKESVIVGILENWMAHVKFDYWVISDTGSTDGTKQRILDFFRDKGIEGEIHNDTWRNYSHNRTKGLSHTFNKTDRVLVLRTRDFLGPPFRLPDHIPNKNAYYLEVENDSYSYPRCLLLDNRRKWTFKGEIKQYGEDVLRTESIYSLTYN
jgi:hypothetical protein